MPKVKLSEHSKPKAPPIDWLWAAVLERKMVYGYDLKALAKIAKVDYSTMRKYIRMSPWRWRSEARDLVCEEFGIVPTQTVKLVTTHIPGVKQ